ncbi:hypothetical protein SRHO_G00044360 [Serrasalmus rhombeus]
MESISILHLIFSQGADISSLAFWLKKHVRVQRAGFAECCGFLLEHWSCQVWCLLWLLPGNAFLTASRAVSGRAEEMPSIEFPPLSHISLAQALTLA